MFEQRVNKGNIALGVCRLLARSSGKSFGLLPSSLAFFLLSLIVEILFLGRLLEPPERIQPTAPTTSLLPPRLARSPDVILH